MTESCAPSARMQLGEVARHLVANSIRQSERLREHVAVDNHRERRDDHNATRAEAEHDEKQERSEEQAPAHSPIAAASPETGVNQHGESAVPVDNRSSKASGRAS